MNKERRKAIAVAIGLLNQAEEFLSNAKDILEEIKVDERDAFDNMPESLQSSDRGQATEAAADALDEAWDTLDNFDLQEIISNLESAAE